MESRTQGSRPRTQKKSEAKVKAKDSLSEDRHSRGQGQKCSRPRPRTKDTSASALQKKKKVFTKIFQAISTKKRFQKIFQALHKILTIQKILLSSSRGQANFRGLEASRPRPRTWPSRPRTSKSVLEDSTSGFYCIVLYIFYNSKEYVKTYRSMGQQIGFASKYSCGTLNWRNWSCLPCTMLLPCLQSLLLGIMLAWEIRVLVGREFRLTHPLPLRLQTLVSLLWMFH